MKIALIGATGFVGTAVLAELLARDHPVTALVRNTAKVPAQAGVTAVALDVGDAAAVTAAVRGHDAVVSAFNPGWDVPDLYAQFMKGSAAIERGVEASGVKRLLVVGGAGSLVVAPGVQMVDTPEFASHVPANIVPGAKAARVALTALRANTALDWTLPEPACIPRAGRAHRRVPRRRRGLVDGRRAPGGDFGRRPGGRDRRRTRAPAAPAGAVHGRALKRRRARNDEGRRRVTRPALFRSGWRGSFLVAGHRPGDAGRTPRSRGRRARPSRSRPARRSGT